MEEEKNNNATQSIFIGSPIIKAADLQGALKIKGKDLLCEGMDSIRKQEGHLY